MGESLENCGQIHLVRYYHSHISHNTRVTVLKGHDGTAAFCWLYFCLLSPAWLSSIKWRCPIVSLGLKEYAPSLRSIILRRCFLQQPRYYHFGEIKLFQVNSRDDLARGRFQPNCLPMTYDLYSWANNPPLPYGEFPLRALQNFFLPLTLISLSNNLKWNKAAMFLYLFS